MRSIQFSPAYYIVIIYFVFLYSILCIICILLFRNVFFIHISALTLLPFFFCSHFRRRHLERRRVQASSSGERSATFWIRSLRHPIPRLHFPSLISVYCAVLCTMHLPLRRSADITSALHLQGACTHAEASESRYIRLRGRARQAEVRRTESRYSGRRIRVSAAHPLVDRPIYRRSRARRAGERRPKLADRVAVSGELMGQPRSVVRERD